MQPKVSIVVITQLARSSFIPRLYRTINLQDYDNIIEIIMVDSSHVSQQHEMKKVILGTKCRFPIKYVPVPDNALKAIGNYRNLGHKYINKETDIIVPVDDDDLIVSTRVSHAVKMLQNNPDKSIAGACDHFIYEPDLDIIFQFTKFIPNHAINPTLAYRRSYLDNHKYDSSRTFAEEGSFLNNFSEDLLELDPKHIFLQMCHIENLYSKREIILNNLTGRVSPYCIPTKYTLKDFIDTTEDYTDIITYKMFDINDRYKPYTNAQIVCYCGHIEHDLGKIEEYASKWAESGLNVEIYSVKESGPSEQDPRVKYKHFKHFNARFRYDVLVIANETGLLLLDATKLHAISIYVHLTTPRCNDIKNDLEKKYGKLTILV